MDQRTPLPRRIEDRLTGRNDDHSSQTYHENSVSNANCTHPQSMNIFESRHGRQQHNEHSYHQVSHFQMQQYSRYINFDETKTELPPSLNSVSNYFQNKKRQHDSTYDEQDRDRKRVQTSMTNQGHVEVDRDLFQKPSGYQQNPTSAYQHIQTEVGQQRQTSSYQQCQTSTYQQFQTPVQGMAQFQPRKPFNGTIVDILSYPAEGVEVVYTNNLGTAESWLTTNIIGPSAGEIGFDIEWKPQFVPKKKGGKENKTAVVQLSVKSSCLVLHIFRMKSLPPSLRTVLSDKTILKVGSGINGDVIKLLNDTGIFCNGRVDTQECAKAVGIHQGIGLKNLAKQVLMIHVDKPKSVSMSNWEYFPLKAKQIQYAALDAWISLKIFLKLREKIDPKNDMAVFSSHVTVQYGDEMLRKKKEKGASKLRNIFKEMKAKQDRESSSSTSQSTDSQEASIATRLCETSTATIATSNTDTTSQQTTNLSPSNSKITITPTLQTSDVATSLTASFSTSQGSRDAEHLFDSKVKNIESKLKQEKAPKDKSQSSRSKPSRKYICPIQQCRREKFETEEELQQHIKSKHVSCKICGQVYRSKIKAKHKKLHANEQC